MTDGNSLISFGDLTKPATVLIEKISDAIGVVFEPKRIKRKAEAEAVATRIKKLAELDLRDEIEQRAISRLLIEETKKQENIEYITYEALNNLNEDAKPEDIEDDWISHFFEKCKIVSDNEMKNLWSRVLAGEANNPGSFSRRTVEFIATLDKKDANDFTNLCRYILTSGMPILLIPEIKSDYFESKSIHFNFLAHMEDIGLIKFFPIADYMLPGQKKFISCQYGSKLFKFEFAKDSGNDFVTGKAKLTRLGEELSTISGATIDETFLSYLKEEYEKSGVKVIF